MGPPEGDLVQRRQEFEEQESDTRGLDAFGLSREENLVKRRAPRQKTADIGRALLMGALADSSPVDGSFDEQRNCGDVARQSPTVGKPIPVERFYAKEGVRIFGAGKWQRLL